MGGPSIRFPSTRWSVIVSATDRTSPTYSAALDELCRLYWKPVYAFIRAHDPNRRDDPKDLTQQFFVEVMEGNLLERYLPQRGAFRNYLLGAVRFFLMEQRNRAATLKRGGGRTVFSLDEEETRAVDRLLTDWKESPEVVYGKMWAQTVLGDALARLEREMEESGKRDWFRAFRRYDLESDLEKEPTYGTIAQELGLTERDVGNYLAFCRRRLRELVVDRVADAVDQESEILSELTHVLSALHSPRP